VASAGGPVTKLHDLADEHKGPVETGTLDIREPDQIAHCPTGGREFDILFVNAGITNNPDETIAHVTTDECIRVIVRERRSSARNRQLEIDPAN
jgi:NADP-dependent 3-hydroxy acid dehydrogenase YdfG